MKIKQQLLYITPLVLLGTWSAFGLKVSAESFVAETPTETAAPLPSAEGSAPQGPDTPLAEKKPTLTPPPVAPPSSGLSGPGTSAPPVGQPTPPALEAESPDDAVAPTPAEGAPTSDDTGESLDGPVEETETDETLDQSQSEEDESEKSVSGETPTDASNVSPQSNTETGDSKSIAEVTGAQASFSTLSTAIQAAGLEGTLAGEGPFTLFAPTNEAFAALPPGVLDALLKPENKGVLIKLLSYHVLPTQVASSDLSSGSVKTLEGTTAEVAVAEDGVTVNNAKVVETDMNASNGIIHSVDKVLVPAALR